MHVAAKAGQVSQVELLTVYGADPGAPDSSGKTPTDYARLAIFNNFIKYMLKEISGPDGCNVTFLLSVFFFKPVPLQGSWPS